MNGFHAPSSPPHGVHFNQPPHLHHLRSPDAVWVKEMGANRDVIPLTTPHQTPTDDRKRFALSPITIKDASLPHPDPVKSENNSPPAASETAPINISKMVQHARAQTNARAWAPTSPSQDPGSPIGVGSPGAASTICIGSPPGGGATLTDITRPSTIGIGSPAGGAATLADITRPSTIRIGSPTVEVATLTDITRPSSRAMGLYTSGDLSSSTTSDFSIAHAREASASDRAPEAAWEDDSSAIDLRSGTDSNTGDSYSRSRAAARRRRMAAESYYSVEMDDELAVNFDMRPMADMTGFSSTSSSSSRRNPPYGRPPGLSAAPTTINNRLRSPSLSNPAIGLAPRKGMQDLSASTPKLPTSLAKVRNADRAKELARLEQAANQLRAQMAAEFNQDLSSDSDQVSGSSVDGRARLSTRAEEDEEDEDEDEDEQHAGRPPSPAAADIAALRQQIMDLHRSHAQRRKAHSGMGDYTLTDVDNDDEFDNMPLPSAPQIEIIASDRRREPQQYTAGPMLRSETPYQRRHADRFVHAQAPSNVSVTTRFHADDGSANRTRSRQQLPHQQRPKPSGRQTPTLAARRGMDDHPPHPNHHQHLQHQGNFFANNSDQDDDDEEEEEEDHHLAAVNSHNSSSRASLATTRSYRRRQSNAVSSLSSSPRSGKVKGDDKLDELSHKIEMLEKIIRGNAFATGNAGTSRPASVAPLPGPRTSLAKSQDKIVSPPNLPSKLPPIPSVPVGGNANGQGKTREAIFPQPPLRKPMDPSSDDDLTDNWAPMVNSRNPLPLNSVGNQSRGVRAGTPSGARFVRNTDSPTDTRRSGSSMGTVTSAFQFNATPAVSSGAGPDVDHEQGSAVEEVVGAPGKSRGAAGALRTLFGGSSMVPSHSSSSSHLPQAQQQSRHSSSQQGDNSSVKSSEPDSTATKEVMLSFSRKRTERVSIPKAKIKQAAGRGRVYVTPL
ncbi:hypothetical protein CF327_g1295 [Tilletia walkeri]|nr:hypothetical protein CF327_g1295 [Tilletia walkeri]